MQKHKTKRTAVRAITDIARCRSVAALIRRALEEDLGSGDATTQALVDPDIRGHAVIVSRQPCCVAGATVAAAVFRRLDSRLQISIKAADGRRVKRGATIMSIQGRLAPILTAERTALNLLQRLCGIATLTARFRDRLRGRPVQILDTRKTTPTLRLLEKHAVLCGGGVNHRMGLYDMVLIKDNHRRLWRDRGGVAAAVKAARRRHPHLPVEVEVENQRDLRAALQAAPDWIMLDNMPPDRMRRCVALVDGRCRLEASGGISLENIRAVAASGVDAISLGCLTHSAPATDLSLEINMDP